MQQRHNFTEHMFHEINIGMSAETVVHEPNREPADVDSVYKVVSEWEEKPTGNDPGVAKIGKAIARLIENNAAFRSSLDDALLARQDPAYFNVKPGPMAPIGGEFAANLVRSAVQYNLLCYPRGKRYPIDYVNHADIEQEVASWYEDGSAHYLDAPEEAQGFDESGKDHRELQGFSLRDLFEVNIIRRFIATNWYKRAVGILIAKYMYGSEFPKEAFNVDIGCSQGEVWAQIASGLPIQNFHILTESPESGLILPDLRRTTRFNRAMQGGLHLGYSLGIDVNDPKDIDNINWSWSSRRPSELVNKDVVNYDYVLTNLYLTDPRLGFHTTDIATSPESIPRAIDDLWPGGSRKINLATVFTTQYELPAEVVRKIQENAAELVGDGLVLFQEPAVLDPDNPTGFEFFDNFRIPGVYKLYGWWPSQNRPIEHLATYDSGRCNAAFLNPDFAADRKL